MLAFTGAMKDPTTGRLLGGLGTIRDLPGLDDLVASGSIEQTNPSGYPLTQLGQVGVFLGWFERLPEHLFYSTSRPIEPGSTTFRSVSGAEVKARAVEALRGLDPERRIQVDFWDES